DGYICALPYNDTHWRDFFVVAGRADLADDRRFSSHSARSENYEALYKMLGSLLSEHSTEYWLERLSTADIPVSRAAKLKDVFEDPHLRKVGLFQKVQHPEKGLITTIRSPIGFSAAPASMGKPAGAVGSDSSAVLRALGYSETEIGRLLEQ